MIINTSPRPAAALGRTISERLSTDDRPTLLLLSGGSALSVLDYIDPHTLHKNITIMMADDRYTTTLEANNYYQFQQHQLYASLERSGGEAIASLPQTDVSASELALAINKTLHYFFDTHPDHQVIAILGVGTDGHTASIFPQSKADFESTFHTTDFYIAVHEESNEYSDRITITPHCLNTCVDAVFLFATGEAKCAVLKTLVDGGVQPHEYPALIAWQHPGAEVYTDCTLTT